MTDVDFLSPARHAQFESLRDEGNVVWSAEDDAWLAVGFAECDEVLRDGERFGIAKRREVLSDERWEELTAVLGGPRAMTLLPEAQHTPMVAQVRRRLASSMPRYLEHRVRPVIEHYMQDFLAGGRGDFAAEFTEVVPPAIIASVLGLPWNEPAMHLRLKQLDAMTVEAATRFGHPSDDNGRLAAAELRAMMLPHIEARRDDPQDDFISQLWEFVPTILPDCTADDILAQCRQLFIGGSHTSTFLMNNCAVLLFSDPGLWGRLKEDRGLVGRLVEEVLRVIGVAHLRPRVVAQDTELGGQSLKAGDQIYAVMAAANRDPGHFPCPHAITLEERDRRRHVAFGAGPRTCAGMALARGEVVEVINLLLDSIDDPRLDPDAPPPVFTEGGSFGQWGPVHVVFDDVRG